VSWIEEWVTPGMLVADVGANRGDVVAELVKAGAIVTAIEPHPEMAQALRDTFPAVTVVQAAASDRDGTATLYHSLDSQQSSLFQPAILQDAGTSEVRTVTLDSLGVFDVVKIDVQGSEVAVLRGATRTLETRKAIWYVEIWRAGLEWAGESVGAVRRIFEAYGYVPHRHTWDHIEQQANSQSGHGSIDALIVPGE
jgi:FkbM family methyltransferase